MAKKSINITKLDENVDKLHEVIGDSNQLVLYGDGTVVDAIKNIDTATLGGIKITLEEYEALENKSGVYYITDANNITSEFEATAEQILALVNLHNQMIGNSDISKIGTGTITNAILTLQSNILNVNPAKCVTQAEYDALEDTKGVYYITDGVGSPTDFQVKIDHIDALLGTTDISAMGDGSITGAVATCFQSVSDGKALVANAITDKGIETAVDAEFATLAANIAALTTTPNLQSRSVTLTRDLIEMTVRPMTGYAGLSSVTVNASTVDNFPVTLSTADATVTSDTGALIRTVRVPGVPGTATASQVLTGETFSSSNGVGITGTMVDYTGTENTASNITSDDDWVYYTVPNAGYYATDSSIVGEKIDTFNALNGEMRVSIDGVGIGNPIHVNNLGRAIADDEFVAVSITSDPSDETVQAKTLVRTTGLVLVTSSIARSSNTASGCNIATFIYKKDPESTEDGLVQVYCDTDIVNSDELIHPATITTFHYHV